MSIEDDVKDLLERTLRLEIWKDGNGSEGAEARLVSIENRHETCMIERLPSRIASLEAVAGQALIKILKEAGFMTKADAFKIAQTAVDTAFEKLHRDKVTGIERLKAAGPIIVAALALAGAIAAPFIAHALYVSVP